MADVPRRTSAEMARQAKQHLESLRAAGVEWLPNVLPPAPEPAALWTAPAAPSSSLFADLSDEGLAKPSGPAPLTPDQRRHELIVLAEQVSHCTRCAELAAT